MTEIYNSNLEDQARQGLLTLYVEALSINNQTLAESSLEKLQELDRQKVKQELTKLRVEINNLLRG
jgi:DNA gyrase/topoisomerase IV subunit A